MLNILARLFFFLKVRSMISDFAVFLTIVLMVLIDYVTGVPSQKLQVPSKFKVKYKKRNQYLQDNRNQ